MSNNVVPFRGRGGDPVRVDVDGDGVPDDVSPGSAAGTEVAVQGPVTRAEVVSVTDLEPRPIIAPWLRSRSQVADRAWIAGYQAGYRVAYHGLRALGPYPAAYAARSPLGLGRVLARWWRWVWDLETRDLRRLATTGRDRKDAVHDYLKLRDAHACDIRARWIATGIAVAVLVPVLVFAPRLWLTVAGLLGVLALGKVGEDRAHPVITPAVGAGMVPKLTFPVVTDALGSLSIGKIDRWLAAGKALEFVSDICRDGTGTGAGYLAVLDLPLGATAGMVVDKREELASGLRRPLGCVWPERDPLEHPARLKLFVLDRDFSRSKPPAWSLAKAGGHDYFQPYPFGWDVRGRLMTNTLFERNMLVGSQPGMGKSATMRVAACSAALDPTVELRICEHAGKGDFLELESCCHVYINGLTDDDLAASAASLHQLRVEAERRLAVLGRLVKDHRDWVPDKKFTRAVCDRPGLGPIVQVLDEAHVLFAHPVYGKSAADDASTIVRLSRAVAITLVIGTQVPDRKSVPPEITRSVALRFALRVLDYFANDAILGTGAFKAGFRATMLQPVDMGIGLLMTESQGICITRSAYLDAEDTARVARRARMVREAAGTLSGHALGVDPLDGDPVVTVDVITDVRAHWPADATGLHWEALAGLLREVLPGSYGDVTGESLSAEMRALGVPSVSVKGDGISAKGCRIKDVAAVAERRALPPGDR